MKQIKMMMALVLLLGVAQASDSECNFEFLPEEHRIAFKAVTLTPDQLIASLDQVMGVMKENSPLKADELIPASMDDHFIIDLSDLIRPESEYTTCYNTDVVDKLKELLGLKMHRQLMLPMTTVRGEKIFHNTDVFGLIVMSGKMTTKDPFGLVSCGMERVIAENGNNVTVYTFQAYSNKQYAAPQEG